MISRHKTRVHIRIDKDARNFIDASGLNTDSNLSVAGLYTAEEARMALHFFVVGLKSLKDIGQTQTVWERMKAVYVFIGGTASMHKFNLKDPRDLDAAFRLVFNSTFTHSGTGALPSSATSIANTYLNPSLNLASQNSLHLSFYSGTNVQNNFYDISAGAGAFRIYGNGSGFNGGQLSSSTFHQIAATNSLGWYGINRINATQTTVFKNQTLNTISNTSNVFPNSEVILFGEAIASASSMRESRLIILGAGLTDLELSSLFLITNNLQSSLKRNPFYS